MFVKFHEKVKEREEGFTLIELLVVILIIAILAAIAIPVFLRQREKGWISQSESALKNAATAMQSFATTNNGAYPTTTANLETEGYRPISDVTLSISVGATGDTYCLTADHARMTQNYYYSSSTGKPTTTAC